jgi:hypothetical protein
VAPDLTWKVGTVEARSYGESCRERRARRQYRAVMAVVRAAKRARAWMYDDDAPAAELDRALKRLEGACRDR